MRTSADAVPTVGELVRRFADERGTSGVPPLLERLAGHLEPSSPLAGVALLQLDGWLDVERQRGTPAEVALGGLVTFLDWCWEGGWLGRRLGAAYADELAQARTARHLQRAGGWEPAQQAGRPSSLRPAADAASQKELARLEAAEGAAVAEMELARQEGDLRENAPYQAARERVAWLRRERAGVEQR
jgi:hypothetical protein